MKAICKSALSMYLIAGLLLGAPTPMAATELVSTSQALALEDGNARELVDAWFAREDIERQLTTLGVDPELAQLRVAAMTGAEIAELAETIEDAPAGGDGVLTVLGITFLVLLILELVGVIDIFKKT